MQDGYATATPFPLRTPPEALPVNPLHRLAKLLVCCWALGGDRDEDLPAGQGVLDRALEIAREKKVFPAWVWDELHFAESRTGPQCVELAGILDWARAAELTVSRDPFPRATQVRVSARVAGRLLDGLAVSGAQAAAWGGALREAARQALVEFASARR